MNEQSLPRTEAGRALLQELRPVQWGDEMRRAILAIEAEAAAPPAPDRPGETELRTFLDSELASDRGFVHASVDHVADKLLAAFPQFASPVPDRGAEQERTVSLEDPVSVVCFCGLRFYDIEPLQSHPCAALAQRDREEIAMTDDADKLAADLHSTTDAMRWTTEFLRLYPNGADADVMLGWFANAIETGRMAGASEAQRPVEAGS